MTVSESDNEKDTTLDDKRLLEQLSGNWQSKEKALDFN
jgi:hypothetical protein